MNFQATIGIYLFKAKSLMCYNINSLSLELPLPQRYPFQSMVPVMSIVQVSHYAKYMIHSQCFFTACSPTKKQNGIFLMTGFRLVKSVTCKAAKEHPSPRGILHCISYLITDGLNSYRTRYSLLNWAPM